MISVIEIANAAIPKPLSLNLTELTTVNAIATARANQLIISFDFTICFPEL